MKKKKASTDGQTAPKKKGAKRPKKITEPEVIFSDTSKETAQTDDNDLFSSSEELEKKKLSNVKAKIKQFEKRNGEDDIPVEEEKARVVPIVINKPVLVDLIELSADEDETKKKEVRTTKERMSGGGQIPPRVINSYSVSMKSGTRLEYKNTVRKDREVHISAPVEAVVDSESEPIESESFIPGDISAAKTMEIDLKSKKHSKNTSDLDDLIEDKTTEINISKKKKRVDDVQMTQSDDIAEDKTTEINIVKKKKRVDDVQPTQNDDIAEDKTTEIDLANKKKYGDIIENISDNKTSIEPQKKKRKKKKKPKPAEGADIAASPVGFEEQKAIEKKAAKKKELAETEEGESPKERVIGARQIPHIASTENKSKSNKTDKTESVVFDKDDAAENSTLAALAYMGVLIILPMMKSSESPFCKAHVKQGARVFWYSVIVLLFTLAVILGLRVLIVWMLGLSFIVYKILQIAVTAAMVVLLMIPTYQGAVAAFSGEYAKVSFVGTDAVRKKDKKINK